MDAKRSRPRRLTGALAAFLGVAALMGCDVSQEQTAPVAAVPADGRTVLELPLAARQQVRSEMRAMLSALNATFTGLASGDAQAVADAARSGGLAVAVDADPSLAELLPAEFRQLGMETHQRFDALAEAASAGLPTDSLLTRVGHLTANCVACHETYTATTLPPGD